MNRYFFGFPKPVPDETIRSWLFRVYVSKGLDGQCFIKTAISSVLTKRHFDIDYNLDSNQIATLADAVGVYPEHLDTLRPEKCWWRPIGDRARIYFCAVCLERDVAAGRIPSWRACWDSFEYVGCHIHKVKLSKLRGWQGRKINKAWRAFEQVIKDKVALGNIHDGTLTDRRWRKLWLLGMIVQNKIRSAYKSGRGFKMGLLKGLSWNLVGMAFHDILALFLRTHQRGREERNICCRILRDQTTYDVGFSHVTHLRILLGNTTRTFDIRLRLICLLCIGVIFGLYSSKQISFLQESGRALGLSIPSTPLEVKQGLLLSSFYSYEGWVSWKKAYWSKEFRDRWDSLGS